MDIPSIEEEITRQIRNILYEIGEYVSIIRFMEIPNDDMFSFVKKVSFSFSINGHKIRMDLTKDWVLGVFRRPKYTVSFYVPDLINMDGHRSEFPVSASNGIFNLGDDVCNHIKNCLSPKLRDIPSGETAFSHSLKCALKNSLVKERLLDEINTLQENLGYAHVALRIKEAEKHPELFKSSAVQSSSVSSSSVSSSVKSDNDLSNVSQ